MTERRRIGCEMAILLVLLTLGSFLAYELNKGWTPGKVERIATNDVPLGSTEKDAKEWLSSQGFTDIGSGSAEGSRYFETRDGISVDGAIRVCYGDAPNPNVDLFCDGTVIVFFFFDADGRLFKVYGREWML